MQDSCKGAFGLIIASSVIIFICFFSIFCSCFIYFCKVPFLARLFICKARDQLPPEHAAHRVWKTAVIVMTSLVVVFVLILFGSLVYYSGLRCQGTSS